MVNILFCNEISKYCGKKNAKHYYSHFYWSKSHVHILYHSHMIKVKLVQLICVLSEQMDEIPHNNNKNTLFIIYCIFIIVEHFLTNYTFTDKTDCFRLTRIC